MSGADITCVSSHVSLYSPSLHVTLTQLWSHVLSSGLLTLTVTFMVYSSPGCSNGIYHIPFEEYGSECRNVVFVSKLSVITTPVAFAFPSFVTTIV